MNKYLIDFQKVIRWLLPSRKRTTVRMAFLFQGMKRLRDIWGEFIAWGPGIRQEAAVNNQVINFQDYLRTRFGDGITIVHQVLVPTLLGNPADTLYTVGTGADPGSWIGGAADSGSTGITFIVQVPGALVYDEDELRAVIDRHKVPGSNYIIEII